MVGRRGGDLRLARGGGLLAGTAQPPIEVRGDGSAKPTSGKNLVVVGADDKGLLHIQVFGPSGNRVADTDAKKLPDQAEAMAALKR